MGLDNDETPEDSWETIELINDLEREQPGSMFTIALTFVPIGLLEKSDFFNIGNEMTPAQLGLPCKMWQHNFKYGIQKFMNRTGARGPQRYLFNGIARAWRRSAGSDGALRTAPRKRAREGHRDSKGKVQVDSRRFYDIVPFCGMHAAHDPGLPGI